MAFWGVEVKPGKPFTLKATNDATGTKRLHLSQATLGLGNNAQTSRSIVQCKVRNKDPLFLCVLYPLKVDSCQLNLEFEEAEDVIFSVYGSWSVHLTGYFLGRSSNTFRLNDEQSESYGIDIADTEGERSSSDDYDYGDSFIDDNDPSARGSYVSNTDDNEITIKERAASEDSVGILKNDNDHKIPKVLSSELPLPSNGETEAKCEKTSEATTDTDKTLDKKEDTKGSEVLSKKKQDKKATRSDSDDSASQDSVGILKNDNTSTDVLPSQNIDKAMESPTPSKKKRKRQAIDNAENTENSSDEVKIEEIEKGKADGKVAVQGKNVSILYTLKLKDTGKLIESNLDEEPFIFRLGEEKVIKGLSIGVEGMRVGDKRRLIIPPSLGYSEEGLKKESVPKNAWLVYEVEAVKVG